MRGSTGKHRAPTRTPSSQTLKGAAVVRAGLEAGWAIVIERTAMYSCSGLRAYDIIAVHNVSVHNVYRGKAIWQSGVCANDGFVTIEGAVGGVAKPKSRRQKAESRKQKAEGRKLKVESRALRYR
jgi:hypothetical protein